MLHRSQAVTALSALAVRCRIALQHRGYKGFMLRWRVACMKENVQGFRVLELRARGIEFKSKVSGPICPEAHLKDRRGPWL